MRPVEAVEEIRGGARLLAYIIRVRATSSATSFITPDEASFQAGFVVYPAGGAVPAHLHLPVRRAVVGTSEMLIVRSGRCIVDIYDDSRALVASRELLAGDAVLSLSGGHGFRMLEATVLLELKQGPYVGPGEKRRFEATSQPDLT